ncbi:MULTISPECIES: DUF6746 family protein [unclassified Methylophaga]|jgi:septal ring factor EnvC (AmiA/AmiB activator)|uniref:DUF6746 family protein n=1 Tax=unclassified Methylophaga TaxID=2629249 RepID=UPI00216D0A63|nr:MULTISPECIES: DUF6746 family protein [unclassified Methylophaga]MBL1458782.1 hypothetical protein [Methylophaga sp.]|tara:strand:- start:1410 stop:1790 length:381 start_codon:yes stop_codon:yes gene_type:complete
MKVMNYLAAAALSFGVATMAKAESVEHFKGESAESLEEAVTNFKRYNQRLENLLKQDSMSADDVTKVHQLTYTLENALAKINDELDKLAVTLEEVHLASEKYDADAVRNHGDAYMEVINTISKMGQ